MWKSPGQYERVDMYAKKQHLYWPLLSKATIKNDKFNVNLQTHHHGAPVCERLKLRH